MTAPFLMHPILAAVLWAWAAREVEKAMTSEIELIRAHYGEFTGLYDPGQAVAHVKVLLAEVERLTYNITSGRMTSDISKEIRDRAAEPLGPLALEAADQLDELITLLAKAETERDEARAEARRSDADHRTMDARATELEAEVERLQEEVARRERRIEQALDTSLDLRRELKRTAEDRDIFASANSATAEVERLRADLAQARSAIQHADGTTGHRTAQRDQLRAELRDAHNDLLDVRGILAPNGYPDVTPLPLVPTVAPAVQWLVDALAAMEQDRDRLSTLADEQTTEIDCYRKVLERIRDLADAIDHGDAATSARTIALKAERVLALEQWDGSVPPGGYVCAICRVPVESEPCPDHSKAVTR